MNNNPYIETKIGATAAIGVAFMISLVFVGGGADANEFSFAIAFIAAIAAVLAMGLVWLGDWLFSSHGKAKRDTTVNAETILMLLQLLDDDSRETLKRRLANELGSDGELTGVQIEQLLQNEPSTQTLSNSH